MVHDLVMIFMIGGPCTCIVRTYIQDCTVHACAMCVCYMYKYTWPAWLAGLAPDTCIMTFKYSVTTQYEYHYKGHELYVQLLHSVYTV